MPVFHWKVGIWCWCRCWNWQTFSPNCPVFTSLRAKLFFIPFQCNNTWHRFLVLRGAFLFFYFLPAEYCLFCSGKPWNGSRFKLQHRHHHHPDSIKRRADRPWWPDRRSPCRAPLHGWGHMVGKCDGSSWRRLGVIRTGWCPVPKLGAP